MMDPTVLRVTDNVAACGQFSVLPLFALVIGTVMTFRPGDRLIF
jgi:hypothetical protein